ncbi:MAG: SRPBCC domain-containing protein [Deltaproteobacteria bacterium]|nr:SRPBCC domain-containing protein [Deltaproteobacteria bacterium]
MDPEYLAKPGRYGKLEFAASGDRELILKRELDAPRGRVFEAFTRPELLLRWLSGPPGWTMSVCRVDPRVGGSYRFEWREERGSGGMAVGGTFREVTAPERFVATERFDQPWYPGEAELEYSFAEKEGKTAITVTVRYESQEARDVVLRSDMPRGLAWCYNQLAMLLAG